jgi:hypothetical protein
VERRNQVDACADGCAPASLTRLSEM